MNDSRNLNGFAWVLVFIEVIIFIIWLADGAK